VFNLLVVICVGRHSLKSKRHQFSDLKLIQMGTCVDILKMTQTLQKFVLITLKSITTSIMKDI